MHVFPPKAFSSGAGRVSKHGPAVIFRCSPLRLQLFRHAQMCTCGWKNTKSLHLVGIFPTFLGLAIKSLKGMRLSCARFSAAPASSSLSAAPSGTEISRDLTRTEPGADPLDPGFRIVPVPQWPARLSGVNLSSANLTSQEC